MSRVGVFGGTFDPIHLGHLRPALELRDVLGLDELRFVPCRIPPHRVRPVATAEVRCEMVARAIAGVPRFALDRHELNRDGPSYTAETLDELSRERRGAQLVLLMGSDAFLGLPGWRDWRRLFALAHVAVSHRPGWTPDAEGELSAVLRERLVAEPAALWKEPNGRILLVEVSQLEISATAVRETAAAGGDIRYLVPESVRAYIEETGCYRKR